MTIDNNSIIINSGGRGQWRSFLEEKFYYRSLGLNSSRKETHRSLQFKIGKITIKELSTLSGKDLNHLMLNFDIQIFKKEFNECSFILSNEDVMKILLFFEGWPTLP